MNVNVFVAIFCLSLLAACSKSDIEKETGGGIGNGEAYQQSSGLESSEIKVEKEKVSIGEETNPDCLGYEALLAMLPDHLDAEAVSEQYFSCDSIAPKASSHFTSEDQNTYWTFSVVTRDLESPPASLIWNIAEANESQKDFLKKGVKSAIESEVLLHELCVNNLHQEGLPDWHKTAQTTSQQHTICTGTDAQIVDDGRWVARAIASQYLYILEIEGEKALQYASAEEASAYAQQLFLQFQ